MDKDIYTTNSNGEAAVRVATNVTGNKTSIYGTDSSGNAAMRVIGITGGGGEVTSVNGKKGVVVLTGEDINATLSDGETSTTATVSEHLQTLKNDEKGLGDQVSSIESKIPGNASAENPLVTKADVSSGSGLPEQAGHTGFLQTDGTNATWSDVAAVTTGGSGSGIVIGGRKSAAKYYGCVAIGEEAVANGSYGTAIGNTSTANGNWSVAIGNNATVTANSAIQLGNGTNDVKGTLRVCLGGSAKNYLLLQEDGTIPSGRLAAAPTEEGTYTLKATVAADGTVTMAWVKEA